MKNSQEYKSGYGQASADILIFLNEAIKMCNEASGYSFETKKYPSKEENKLLKEKIDALKYVRSFLLAKIKLLKKGEIIEHS